MFNVRHSGRWLLAGALAMIVSGALYGQNRTATFDEGDIFTSVQKSLDAAADRTLAAFVADRSWMKMPESRLAVSTEHSGAARDDLIRFHAAINRVEQLRPIIEPILSSEGVPANLSAIVLIESGGLANATSPKGARGLWQLMPDTARRYGLTVDQLNDERVDITLATRAAAQYLRELHQQFGDWQLALAAYNTGERTVQHAINSSGGRDFSDLKSLLPFETRSYVPAVIAAMNRIGIQSSHPCTRVMFAPSDREPGK